MNQHYADIAASIQQVTEEVLIVHGARSLHKETGMKQAVHRRRRGAEQRRQSAHPA